MIYDESARVLTFLLVQEGSQMHRLQYRKSGKVHFMFSPWDSILKLNGLQNEYRSTICYDLEPANQISFVRDS